MKKANLRCFFFDHRFNGEDGFILDCCARCGLDYCEAAFGCDGWTLKQHVQYWWYVRVGWRICEFIRWCRPCGDCGKRFCNTPDDETHLPF